MEICGFSMTAALSHRSRALTALALALPIPLLAALGLSLPLPATVERLAAGLVPFADHAAVEAAPTNGSIVAAAGERLAATSAEGAPTGSPGLIARPGRVVRVRGGSLPAAADAPRSTPRGDAQTSTTAAPESTPAPTTTSTQPSSGGTEPQQDPAPTPPDPTPTPTPTPTPAPPSVVDTVTTTASNTVTTVANTVTTVTNTANGIVGGLPHHP
jgi:hypothetical protein